MGDVGVLEDCETASMGLLLFLSLSSCFWIIVKIFWLSLFLSWLLIIICWFAWWRIVGPLAPVVSTLYVIFFWDPPALLLQIGVKWIILPSVLQMNCTMPCCLTAVGSSVLKLVLLTEGATVTIWFGDLAAGDMEDFIVKLDGGLLSICTNCDWPDVTTFFTTFWCDGKDVVTVVKLFSHFTSALLLVMMKCRFELVGSMTCCVNMLIKVWFRLFFWASACDDVLELHATILIFEPGLASWLVIFLIWTSSPRNLTNFCCSFSMAFESSDPLAIRVERVAGGYVFLTTDPKDVWTVFGSTSRLMLVWPILWTWVEVPESPLIDSLCELLTSWWCSLSLMSDVVKELPFFMSLNTWMTWTVRCGVDESLKNSKEFKPGTDFKISWLNWLSLDFKDFSSSSNFLSSGGESLFVLGCHWVNFLRFFRFFVKLKQFLSEYKVLAKLTFANDFNSASLAILL